MKNTLLFVITFIAAQLLMGCGSLNTISFYEPIVESSQIPTSNASDGIAFSAGEICIHVSEGGTKGINPRAMTLIGVPVLPVGFKSKKYEMDYFD